LFWLSSAFAEIIADSETLEGESGIVPMDPRRSRPLTALGRLPPA
jgi:hypothetical protein